MLTKDDFNQILEDVRKKLTSPEATKQTSMTNGTSDEVQEFLGTLSDEGIKNKLVNDLCQNIEKDIDWAWALLMIYSTMLLIY